MCSGIYDNATHEPKILSCTHTCCLDCLTQQFEKSGYIVCPEGCPKDYTSPEQLPVNRVLLNMRDTINIRCEVHNSDAALFCFTHYAPVCAQCSHPGCEVVEVADEADKIKFRLITKVMQLDEELKRNNIPLPVTVTMQVKNVYNNSLRINVSVVQKMVEQVECLYQLTCKICKRRQELTLYQQTFEVFCRTCMTQGGIDGKSFSVNDEASARSALEECIRNLLGSINFCDLDLDVLHRLAERGNQPPTAVLELTQVLIGYMSAKKKTDELPREFFCGQCFQRLELITAKIRVLPCSKALHAICENCASNLRDQVGVSCPLDGFYFRIAAMNLPQFCVPSLSHPVLSSKLEIVKQKPVNTPSEPAIDRHPQYPGTLLPPVEKVAGCFVLDRFPSVLPAMDCPESRYSENNCGWGVSTVKNQVEAMIFTCYDSVKLTGLGISNPIKPGVNATLQFVKIYAGSNARGAAMFTTTPNLQLSGGNSLITYYNFPSPFSVNGSVKYTIKLKIAPPAGPRELLLYRGNPFERPDFWSGSDFTMWEFEEGMNPEEGEILAGQNNLAGPILRFFYKK